LFIVKQAACHTACHRDPASPASLCVQLARHGRGWLLAALVLAGSVLAATASAAGVAAGTKVKNTVVVSYVQGGVTLTDTASNMFVVDQLIDVVTLWQDAKPVQAVAGSATQTLLFKVTNTGNGNDSFGLVLTALPASGTDFSVDQCKLFLDLDNSGTYSSNDPEYVPGNNDPAIAAGAHLDVFALCSLPATTNDGTLAHVRLAATSMTLSGAPGSAKPGTGASGLTLVVGLSGGASSANGTYQASSVNYVFTSTQAVTDKSGGHVATSGSTILYTLTVAASGGSAAGRNLVVTNPLSEHTSYVPGSLVLDSTPLADDGAGNSPGDFNVTASNAITVRLGNMPGTASPHVISFKVTIN
jgi:uncharacterized repeat protein (TIGR01451 family)